MSLLSKILVLFIFSIQVIGLNTDENPLFDPYLSAKITGLGKSASFSKMDYNNMLQNPATITDLQGISIHANNYLDIDYSAIMFCNKLYDLTFAIHYLGSNISGINRSVAEGTLVTEVVNSVPYEFHSFSMALAKELFNINFGIGLQYSYLVLDDVTEEQLNEFVGLSFNIIDSIRFGLSIQNITPKNDVVNALQKEHPIYGAGLSYNMTNFSSVHISFINNQNEVSTHSTVHYGMEHYIGEYIPIRVGLDHNRYTYGIGLNLDPLEIDFGLAMSRNDVVEDQLSISVSYAIKQKNDLYK